MARFRVYVGMADRVEVVGTFTGWCEKPVAMKQTGDGWWTVSLRLPPGDHRFRYRVDGHVWMTDYAAAGVARTRAGDWDSLLAVKPGAASSREERTSRPAEQQRLAA